MKWLVMVSMMMVMACSTGDGGASCVEGETRACLLPSGDDGYQICTTDNRFTPCQEFENNDVGGSDLFEETPDTASVTETRGDGGCVPDCQDRDCGDDGCGGSCGTCPEGYSCQAGLCVEGPCEPECSGKSCGDDGCGGSCGDCGPLAECVEGQCGCLYESCAGMCCAEGESCYAEACCAPDCADKDCGDNGCGGLCNNCLDIIYDDGETETAYGYSTPPDQAPTRIACVVRYDLPAPNMTLTQFSAGWMWGLYNLQVPFELAWLPATDMDCAAGPDGAWYKEWCSTKPDKLHSLGQFLPLEPYEPMGVELLGEVVFPTDSVYMVALFDIDEYPIFVCPIDTSGDGSLAYMMPQHPQGEGESIDGPSFDKTEGNVGVVPFRIRVELSSE